LYPYIDIVVGLAWSKGPDCYASGSIAAGRAPHARQVMTQTKKLNLLKAAMNDSTYHVKRGLMMTGC